jgi:hypothetical protein
LKKLPVLLVFLILASCGSNPKNERESTPFQRPETAQQAATQQPETEENGGEVSIYLPSEELDWKEPELAKLPDAVIEFADADYPEPEPEDTASLPESFPVPIAELPFPSQPDQAVPQQIPPETPQTQPEQIQSPPPAVAVQPPQPTVVQPPQTAVQREAPPPPPVTVRPSQPALPPQQERENPSYHIPDLPFMPVTIVPESSEPNLPYSRTVRALVGQYVEIPFRGSGWVFLGEFGSRRGVSYYSRQMESEGMTFVFRALAEGTYSLRFNRQDYARDFILNDYVKVIVQEPPPPVSAPITNP